MTDKDRPAIGATIDADGIPANYLEAGSGARNADFLALVTDFPAGDAG